VVSFEVGRATVIDGLHTCRAIASRPKHDSPTMSPSTLEQYPHPDNLHEVHQAFLILLPSIWLLPQTAKKSWLLSGNRSILVLLLSVLVQVCKAIISECKTYSLRYSL
jgi:hypothetical protein